jgi:hypothetical protein
MLLSAESIALTRRSLDFGEPTRLEAESLI